VIPRLGLALPQEELAVLTGQIERRPRKEEDVALLQDTADFAVAGGP
jgi:hypothetical protein